ncbi:MAG TPA: hypothetical protein VKF84_18225 [Candidatus Sulfotelmatobacter sp.]|nr:hypothetical protein [Candidatus Sulfotelmatobacter sp.]
MPFAIFKGEKSIGELIARIFRPSTDTTEAEQQTAEALLRANPQLANISNVPPGTKIVVPEAPLPVNQTEVKNPTPVSPTAPNTLLISQRLGSLKTDLPAAASATVADANATIALTQNAQVQAAAAKDPALAQRLATINQQANTRIKNAQALQAQFQKAIGPLQAHLSKLVKS